MNNHEMTCLTDPQSSLTIALQRKNLIDFERALSVANAELVDPKTSLTTFELVCQTPSHSKFIKACINHGCDVNRCNEDYQKYPIHFVTDSEDVNNVRALVESLEVRINQDYDGQTAVQLLAQNMTDDNFKNHFECIKVLIEHGADINIPDENEMTALSMIINNRDLSLSNKRIIVEYLLVNTIVDLDTYRDGEARDKLRKQYPDLMLPVERTEQMWDFNILLSKINRNQEQEFIYGLEQLNITAEIDNLKNVLREQMNGETLLIAAARQGMRRACELLIRSGANVNDCPPNKSSALKVACVFGNWEIIALLLKSPQLRIHDNDTLLIDVVKNIGEREVSEFCSYHKSFDLLLNHPAVDVNQTDLTGSTALHYAVRHNNQPVIKRLLENQSYIGIENRFSNIPITDINCNLLEDHFDSCITTNNRKPGDDDFEIEFNYGNLVPPGCRLTARTKGGNCSDEMIPIEYLANCKELQSLVKHPLIASFLFLKWHRLALIFYINFIFYAIFCLALICYLLFCYGKDASQELAAFLYCLVFIGILYIFVREVCQFVMAPTAYLSYKENYLEIALIIMTIIVLCPQDLEATRRTVAAFTILLSVGELFILSGSLPILSFSTHLVMLQTVSKSFLRSLALYSIILVAFALCFYTLLCEDPLMTPDKSDIKDSTVMSTSAKPDGEDDSFNTFQNPGLAIIKTVVMLTGEFDAGSINFKYNLYSYVIFLIFVFLISTVLFNLLNGLAVSDTHAIKSEAELMNFIYRAHLMGRYERVMIGKTDHFMITGFIRQWSTGVISLFPDYLPLHKIIVQPNKNNLILIPFDKKPPVNEKLNKDPMVQKLLDVEQLRDYKHLECPLLRICCWFGNKCSQMEPKIVKYGKGVLLKKQLKAEEAGKEMEMMNRMTRIENSIDDIRKILLKLEIRN